MATPAVFYPPGSGTGGGGDFSSNTSTSVVNEVVLFADTTGKVGKRSTGTGVTRIASGVQSAAELSGDVTTSGTNAVTIANDAVTYAKMQNVSAASKLLGRGSAGGSGDPEEITLGTGLTMTGTTLAASGGGSSDLYVAKVSSDVTVNNTVALADITGMVLPVLANEEWFAEINIIANSGTTPDIKFGWSVPAACTIEWGQIALVAANFYFNTPIGTAHIVAANESAVVGGEGAATNILFHFRAHIHVGGTAGNVQFRFAQNTATVANSIIRKGSNMVCTRSA